MRIQRRLCGIYFPATVKLIFLLAKSLNQIFKDYFEGRILILILVSSNFKGFVASIYCIKTKKCSLLFKNIIVILSKDHSLNNKLKNHSV